MKKILKEKVNKIILVMIIFVLLISNYVFAEEEKSTTNTGSGITFLGEKMEKEEEPILEDFTTVELNKIESKKEGYTVDKYPSCPDPAKYKGYYKNWIIDLGEVKMTFYNASGELLKSINILPTQFAGTNVVSVNKTFVEGDHDVILRGSKPDCINIGGKFFSDNIPLMINWSKDHNETPYNKFNLWSGAKTFADWSADSNNLTLLLKDIGMENDSIFGGKDALTWLKESGSIIMEPVSYYPISNQEIETNMDIGYDEYGFTYNLKAYLDALSSAFDNLSEADITAVKNNSYAGDNPSLTKWLSFVVFYHCGINRSTETTTVRHYLAIGDEYEGQKVAITDKWKNIASGVHEEIRTMMIDDIIGQMVEDIAGDLTDEEKAEKAREKAKEVSEQLFDKIESILIHGYLVNYGIDLATGNISALTNDLMDTAVDVKIKKEITKGICSVFNNAFDNMNFTTDYDGNIVTNTYHSKEAQKVLKKFVDNTITINILGGLKEFKDELIGQLNELGSFIGKLTDCKYDEEKDAYYFEEIKKICATHFVGLTYTETTKYSVEWVNKNLIGDIWNFLNGKDYPISTIDTDHNKYFITIPKSKDEKVKAMQAILVTAGVLKDEDPMRRGSCLVFGGSPGGLILIKFNANLDQIGGAKTEELPSDYWLVGRVGSSEYQWYQKYDDGTEGAKIQKFPKTFPDSIADGLGGENHEYTTYGTIKQSEEGQMVGGKKFKVDKKKALTQEILDSAIEKQEKTDKKNLKQAVLDALGYSKLYETANAAKNGLGVDEVIPVTLEGKTYYIDDADENKWSSAIDDYNDNKGEVTKTITDDKGNTYTVLVLYVDWLDKSEDEGQANGRELVLYEDELSYVYDYDDIGNDDTRKLQGKIDSGGKQHPFYNLAECGSHTCFYYKTLDFIK